MGKTEKTHQIDVSGIPVTVTKKAVKNMYLRIKKEDGRVLVSAPLRASEAQIERFILEHLAWIEKNRKKYGEAKKSSPAEELSREELEKRKKDLKEAVEALVKKWEPVIGVMVSGITIRRMKTRWGSCNVRTHHININLSLAKKPPEYLEYVVVHEMVHILEASHNRIFWDYMTKFYPDWKAVRKRMNEETAD